MIGSIRGAVSAIHTDHAVVTVGGIGYIIFTTPDTLTSLSEGEEASLYTHLAVRENSLDLYGFESEDELRTFELLLGVSGIGPKSALGILSVVGFRELRKAVAEESSSYLTKVSGIGKKTAERIIMELADKMTHDEKETGTLRRSEDALEALVAMGYSAREAREALKKVPDDVEDSSARLKEALRVVSGEN